MGQIIALIVSSTLLNLSYFLTGLLDSRISAFVRDREDNLGFLVDLGRLSILVSMQIFFYMTAGLEKYSAFYRFGFHGISVAALAFGTKLSVVGLTGGIATGKSTVDELLVSHGQEKKFRVIDCERIINHLY